MTALLAAPTDRELANAVGHFDSGHALALRPYQREAVDAILTAEDRGVRRQLVAMPTGSGKTVAFSHLIRERPGRALILAHRDELITQAVEKLSMVDPTTTIGVVKAERDEHQYPVVVASVQTFARPARLDRLAANPFDTVIVDEAHHATARTYRDILSRLGAFDPDGPLLVGFTATAERADNVGLGAVFEEITFDLPMLPLIRAGYLSDLRAIQVSLRVDFDRLHIHHGDYAEAELGQALEDANAPSHAVLAYRQHAAGRPALVFTPTVALAHQMARTFTAARIPAEAVSGETPIDERRAMLRRLASGETLVIANAQVLTEGFDAPNVSCIVVARPTQSRPLYMQMIGRASRRYPGKDDALILDLVGVAHRHELVTTATLFGLEPDEIRGRSLSEAVARREEEGQAAAIRGELVARTVDLFRQREIHWVQAGDLWLLSIGTHGQLALMPRSDGYDVVRTTTDGVRDVIATDRPLDYAMGIAEDQARQYRVDALLSRDAPWRAKPASQKQSDALRRFRIAARPGMTAGEASDLISAAIAMRGRRS